MPDRDLSIRIFQVMALHRAVEDRMVSMYRQGEMLGSVYTGHWHEAIAVGTAAALRQDDFLCPIHRDLGAHLWRGMEPWQVMASFLGKATSPTGGRDGTLHYGRLDLNVYNLPSHIPDNYPVAIGGAFAFKYRGRGPGGPRVLRRRLDLARRLPRGDQHRGRAGPAVHLRGGEQPVRVLHAAAAAVAHRLRDQGGRVRHPGREGRRHRRDRGVRGDPNAPSRGPAPARGRRSSSA